MIVDKALEKREWEGKPIRVAMVGAGFMGRGIAYQICNVTPGMRLVAIANRHPEKARQVFEETGACEVYSAHNHLKLEEAIDNRRPVVTDDPLLLCEAGNIDLIIEVTGSVEFGAHVVLAAINHHKHVVLMNSELDATVGPILKVYADRNEVVITTTDGDQPGVIMNLYRFVKGIGCRPALAGSIKGLHDPYRTPATQKEFAARWGQNPEMVTAFADGTKVSFEEVVVANATGMKVGRRGMYGPTVPEGTSVMEAAKWFPMEEIGPEGIVDYVTGASPSPGVFILAACDQDFSRHYLNLYKLGPGPWYCFYTPYHLCHFEVPNTVARAVLFGDAVGAPLGPPSVGVVATAKAELKAGKVLDGIGCYMTYGQCENIETIVSENLLPMGLAEGCALTRDIPKDQVLTFADVLIPPGRLSDRLYNEQTTLFIS